MAAASASQAQSSRGDHARAVVSPSPPASAGTNNIDVPLLPPQSRLWEEQEVEFAWEVLQKKIWISTSLVDPLPPPPFLSSTGVPVNS